MGVTPPQECFELVFPNLMLSDIPPPATQLSVASRSLPLEPRASYKRRVLQTIYRILLLLNTQSPTMEVCLCSNYYVREIYNYL